MKNTVIPSRDIQIKESDISIVHKLAEHVYNLQLTLPKNKDDLPTAYIDAQIIASSGLIEGSLTSDFVSKAVIKINYEEGIPLVSGLPFWERLDGELIDYYTIFKEYRNQKDKGFLRSHKNIAEAYNLPINFIYSLSKVYHWTLRINAYDLYKKRELEFLRNKQITDMEGKHTKAAKEVFESTLQLYQDLIGDKDKKWFITPKNIHQMLEFAVKLERLSLGISPDKPLNEEENGRINNVIQNYNLAKTDNKTMNVITNPQDLEEIVKVLMETGALDSAIKKERGELEEIIIEGKEINE